MSKSLEALEGLKNILNREGFEKWLKEKNDLIKQDLERLEELEKENQELKEQLKLSNDSQETVINTMSLVEKENQELREEYISTLKKNNEALKTAINKIDKLQTAIEILKKLKIDIYEGWGTWCIKINDWIEIEEKQANLLKEVFGNE